MTMTRSSLAAVLLAVLAGCGSTSDPICFDVGAVCGANGLTYATACDAKNAGVAYQSGACEHTGAGGAAGTQAGGSGGAVGGNGGAVGGSGGAVGGNGGAVGGSGGAVGGSGGAVGGSGGAVGGNGGAVGGNGGAVGGSGGAVGGNGGAGGNVDGGSRTCGGIAGLRCASGETCIYPTGLCRAPDAAGTCRLTGGVACAQIYAPVCGCDGQTYSNECMANAAGTSILSNGTCAQPDGGSPVCGGFAGRSCADSSFCEFAPGECRIADAAGHCQQSRGILCTADVAPVCGCDGKTYSNSCIARTAAVSVLHQGSCEQ